MKATLVLNGSTKFEKVMNSIMVITLGISNKVCSEHLYIACPVNFDAEILQHLLLAVYTGLLSPSSKGYLTAYFSCGDSFDYEIKKTRCSKNVHLT